jgi:hypothetical protein
MALVTTDIDIDFANRDKALNGLHYIPAMVEDAAGRRTRHVSGVYFQPVPVDPLSGICAYPYDEAGKRGYFKIDFLNNSIYQGVQDESHLDALLAQETPWEAFDDPVFVSELPHISKHFGTVQMIRPRSIDDLAVVIALIRPGKRHLIGSPRDVIDASVWLPCQGGYHFKRAHAVAYAVSITIKLKLIIESMGASLDAVGDSDGLV